MLGKTVPDERRHDLARHATLAFLGRATPIADGLAAGPLLVAAGTIMAIERGGRPVDLIGGGVPGPACGAPAALRHRRPCHRAAGRRRRLTGTLTRSNGRRCRGPRGGSSARRSVRSERRRTRCGRGTAWRDDAERHGPPAQRCTGGPWAEGPGSANPRPASGRGRGRPPDGVTVAGRACSARRRSRRSRRGPRPGLRTSTSQRPRAPRWR